MHSNNHRSERGFTLLELLIAISIFAVVSAMAYSGLASVLNTRKVVDERAETLLKVQKVFGILQREVSQIANRPIRDAFGDTQPAVKSSTLGAATYLEFTHGGYQNPLLQARSSLRRVAYRLDEESLVRLTWPV